MKDDGGPAFPWCGDLNDCPTINLGLTLRDYFAAKAMHGMLSGDYTPHDFMKHTAAQSAYQIADAMMAARDKP